MGIIHHVEHRLGRIAQVEPDARQSLMVDGDEAITGTRGGPDRDQSMTTRYSRSRERVRCSSAATGSTGPAATTSTGKVLTSASAWDAVSSAAKKNAHHAFPEPAAAGPVPGLHRRTPGSARAVPAKRPAPGLSVRVDRALWPARRAPPRRACDEPIEPSRRRNAAAPPQAVLPARVARSIPTRRVPPWCQESEPEFSVTLLQLRRRDLGLWSSFASRKSSAADVVTEAGTGARVCAATGGATDATASGVGVAQPAPWARAVWFPHPAQDRPWGGQPSSPWVDRLSCRATRRYRAAHGGVQPANR